jgi:hypothetical protein
VKGLASRLPVDASAFVLTVRRHNTCEFNSDAVVNDGFRPQRRRRMFPFDV